VNVASSSLASRFLKVGVAGLEYVVRPFQAEVAVLGDVAQAQQHARGIEAD
jgi:hypothetical protein